jgi:hypothetical protein
MAGAEISESEVRSYISVVAVICKLRAAAETDVIRRSADDGGDIAPKV